MSPGKGGISHLDHSGGMIRKGQKLFIYVVRFYLHISGSRAVAAAVPFLCQELILKRIPYRITAKELDIPAYRRIGIALRNKKNASLAVQRFLEYLDYR